MPKIYGTLRSIALQDMEGIEVKFTSKTTPLTWNDRVVFSGEVVVHTIVGGYFEVDLAIGDYTVTVNNEDSFLISVPDVELPREIQTVLTETLTYIYQPANGNTDPSMIPYANATTRGVVLVDTLVAYPRVYIKETVDSLLAGKLSLAGGTMTGALVLAGEPTAANHAATKDYVDSRSGGGGGGITFSDLGVESPITKTGTEFNPIIGILPASNLTSGSMSIGDKAKVDAVTLVQLQRLVGVTSNVQGQLDGLVSKSEFTTKGDLLVRGASVVARFGVGSNGQVLIADSAEALGIKWGAAGAGDMVLSGVQTVTGAKTFGTIGGAAGKLILAGSTSGSTIFNAAAVAGSTTITLPGITGTVALTSDLGSYLALAGGLMTGALGVVAGTNSAPGIYFSGDTNTGIYSSSADVLNFATGGLQRWFIGSTGTLTSANLTQTASNPILNLLQTWNNGAVVFTAFKINVVDTASDVDSLVLNLSVGGSPIFTVNKAGLVDFDKWAGGTVEGDLVVNGQFSGSFSSANSYVAGYSSADNSTSGGHGYGIKVLPTLNQTSTAAYTDLYVNRIHTAIGSGAQLFVDFAVSGTTKFSIDSDGNVLNGIWTASQIGNAYIAGAAVWSSKQPGDATLTALATLTITAGSLITGTGADAFSVIAAGTDTYVLTMVGGAPAWAAAGGGSGDMILASVQTVTGAKTFSAGKLVQAGAGSGTVTFAYVNSAANVTATFPSVTGTVCLDVGSANIVTVGTLAAGVVPTSLLTGTLAAGQMPALTGDVSNSAGSLNVVIGANKVTLGMMATLDANSIIGNNTGSPVTPMALSASQVKTLLSLNNVENTGLSTWAGTANIITLGTVTTGTWSATAVLAGKGGTGQTTYIKGDLLVSPGSDTLNKLAVGGTDGWVLTVDTASTNGVKWAAAAGGGDMVLASAQTNSGAKTFLDTTFLLRNVANTFNGSFVNSNTANRVYTLKDAAGTLAFTSDITGTNSGTNTGDQTSIVGITGTLEQFNTAVTDAELARTDAANTFTGIQTFSTAVAVTSGGTGLSSTTINQILYSSATSTIAGLATANSGVLVTSGAGVPSIATDIPTAVTIGSAYIHRVGGTDVAVADGGTNLSSYAVGDILYASATTTIAKLAGVAAGQPLLSGGVVTAPAYAGYTFVATAAQTYTFPTTTATIARTDAANSFTGTQTFLTAITLGVQQTTQGSIALANTAAGAFQTTLQSSNTATAAWTLTLPTTAGTSGYVLQTNGSGVTSWVASGGTGTVTSVGWTGGIVSIATATTTPAFTIAGTSGGVPYFNSATSWATSALLTQYGVMLGGGAAGAPTTTAAATTTTFALFATATSPAFRALAAGDLPTTLTSGTAITNAALTTPTLGVASATSIATSAASPLLLTNGQLVTVAVTSQTVGGSTLTIPDMASAAGTFAFINKVQTWTGVQTLTSPSISSPAFSGAATGTANFIPVTLLNSGTDASGSTFWCGNGTWATPAGGGDMLLGTAQTVTAEKRFNQSTLVQWNPAGTFKYIFTSSALITADKTITLPLLTASDTFVFQDFAQALTNKTLSLGSNTVSGTKAQFDTACTDGNFIYGSGTTNKLAKFSDSNTLTSSVLSETATALTATYGTMGNDLDGDLTFLIGSRGGTDTTTSLGFLGGEVRWQGGQGGTSDSTGVAGKGGLVVIRGGTGGTPAGASAEGGVGGDAILRMGSGGTGNGGTPGATGTIRLEDPSGTAIVAINSTGIVTGTWLATAIGVTKGGTGLTATTINQILYSSATSTIAGLATANSGVLVTSGAGVPSIATDIPTAVTIGSAYIHRVGGTDVVVADGGTGVSSATAFAVLCGGTTSTAAFQSIASVGTSGQVLTSNGAGALPTFQAGGGSGTVTATGGSLTANSVVLGAGTVDTKVLAGITTDGTAKLILGVNVTTLGSVKMFGNTSGDVTIQPTAAAGTATVLTLPATTGTVALTSDLAAYLPLAGGLMTGAFGIIAGSAAAPGLYFSGDTNTGIYSSVADRMDFVTGGTLRWSIGSTGNLFNNGPTLTSSSPTLNMAQTWNSGGVTFTAIKMDVTDTTSAAASLLMDLQVGTVAKFSVKKGGEVTVGIWNGTAVADAYISSASAWNALVTNATHSGDASGATTLTLNSTAITGKTAVTAVGADYVLISDTSDSGNLKKALVSDFAGGGTVTATGGSLTANSVVLGAGTVDTKVLAGITTDGTAQLILGVNATTLGSIKMFGNTSGDVTIQPTGVAGTATVLTLPATTGTVALTSDLSAYLPLAGGTLTGNLTVSAAKILITGAVVSNIGLELSSLTLSNSSLQSGIYNLPTCSANTFSNFFATYVGAVTPNSGSCVVTTCSGLTIANLSKGAASTVTNAYGLFVNDITGGATLNLSIYSAGAVKFATTLEVIGHVTLEGITSTGAIGTGKLVFDTSPALVTPALGTVASGVISACTSTGMVLTTPVLAGGLTASGSGANDFSASTGTFKTSTGAVTIGTGAVSVTGITTFTPPVRTSGVAAYLTITAPADTGQTASTESIGVKLVTATRTWADGTVALQREVYFPGMTYNKTTTSATFTDIFNAYFDAPTAGTGVTFTRKHTLGIVDATSATSSITGAFIVATTIGTTATSVGIGGGNINAGGNGTFGGTLAVTGVATFTVAPVLPASDPTVTTLGAIGVDMTTEKQFLVGDGSAAMVMGVKKNFKTFVLDAPTASTTFPLWQVPYAVTLTRVYGAVLSGTSLTFNIEERSGTTLNSAGTNTLTSSMVADANGDAQTAFTNAGIAADAYLVLVTSAMSGTVGQVVIMVEYTIDRG